MNSRVSSVSVIMPTYGRPELASQVLVMLHQQTRPPDEVVVVSQTEDGQPDPRLRPPEGHAYRLNILHHEPLGTSAARNRGAQATSGDLLIFLDDDVRFEPDLVEQYVRIFEQEPNVDVVHGGVRQRGCPLPPERRVSPDTDLFRFLVSSPNCARRSMAIGLASGNFAITRRWFFAVGGFDENLVGLGDDHDIGLRLFLAGALIVYDPRPCIEHLRVPDGGRRSGPPQTRWARLFRPYPDPGWTYLLLKNLPERAARSLLLDMALTYLRPRRADPLKPLRWPILLARVLRSVTIAKRLLERGPAYLTADSLSKDVVTPADTSVCGPAQVPDGVAASGRAGDAYHGELGRR